MSEQLLKEILSDLKEIKETMVTKEYLDQVILEQQKDVVAMLQHIDKKLDKQNDQLEDKFDALNERLFSQETQIQRLKKLAK